MHYIRHCCSHVCMLCGENTWSAIWCSYYSISDYPYSPIAVQVASPVHDRRDGFATRMHNNVVYRLMLHRSLHCVYTNIYSAWKVRTYCSHCLGSAAMGPCYLTWSRHRPRGMHMHKLRASIARVARHHRRLVFSTARCLACGQSVQRAAACGAQWLRRLSITRLLAGKLRAQNRKEFPPTNEKTFRNAFYRSLPSYRNPQDCAILEVFYSPRG